mmetsp:Transcript_8178/g.24285  ORF Transcript_8178/g.24285 Transcript_8178/m.24285 type:complete len:213 (+) Transcript_8178:340-978(+)
MTSQRPWPAESSRTRSQRKSGSSAVRRPGLNLAKDFTGMTGIMSEIFSSRDLGLARTLDHRGSSGCSNSGSLYRAMPRSRSGGTITPSWFRSSGSQMPRIMSRFPPPSACTRSKGGRTASSTRGGIIVWRCFTLPQPHFSSLSSSKMLIVLDSHSCGTLWGTAARGFGLMTLVSNWGKMDSRNSGRLRNGRWKGSARASMGQRCGAAGWSGS